MTAGVLLQAWGGGFFLLNKVFLWLSERARRDGKHQNGRRWRIVSWVIYLLGLPPWLVIFAQKSDWIAAALEASGIPAMLLGLVLAIRGSTDKPPAWLDRLTLVMIPAGVLYSVHDLGGFGHLSQWLESALVLGYLVGTRQLGLERASGYLWYVLMHLACGLLMFHQGLYGLMALQIISLAFIADAYRVWRTTHS